MISSVPTAMAPMTPAPAAAMSEAVGQGWTVADMPWQSGRRALISGANSGIGYYAALELAR